tara:strand:- start:242 stop:652 length:411 start_codon:yes stop_codon:yes gene_type:complete
MTNYIAYTLVDISNTNESKFDRNKIKFFQQQNLNTLVQTIGLRSQPMHSKVELDMAQDIANLGFGKQYQGLHTVWKMQFSIEHSGVFSLKDLLDDCNGIPIYTELEETTELPSKCFETYDSNLINLCFEHYSYWPV